MSVKISFSGGVMIAAIEGEIDHHTAKDIRESIDYSVNEKKPRFLKLDFRSVPLMDSSGIGLIMGRYKLVNSYGGKLKVINVPKRLERIIKLSGLGVLKVFESEGV